jgi:flagellar motor switch protein FliM
MAEGRGDVIRRKLGLARADAALRAEEGRPGPDKVWRLALARAARDRAKLALDITRMSLDRMSLAEVLELAPERGLIAVLEGPARALGVILLSPDVLTGLIEAQTTGIVTNGRAPERRPTRTDAAMAAGLIDGALEELEVGLNGQEDGDWARGYRYSSFLEDVRPLGLLLEDVPYFVLRGEVSLAFGAKRGAIFMAMLAEPRQGSSLARSELRLAAEALLFSHNLSEQVLASECQLDGVLARISLPLSEVMDLELGQILPLGSAAVERISLEGMDGRKLWEGRLGQNRGLRAVRLTEQLSVSDSRNPPIKQPATRQNPGMTEMEDTFDALTRATGTG